MDVKLHDDVILVLLSQNDNDNKAKTILFSPKIHSVGVKDVWREIILD